MKKGFTLVELVIVIVIVGILSIVAIPIYRGYVEKAKQTEGKALASAIRTAQMIYYAEHGTYYSDVGHRTGSVIGYDAVLGIDSRGNKYYNRFRTNPDYGVMFAVAISSEDFIDYAWDIDPSNPVVLDGHKAPWFRLVKDGEVTYL